MLREPADAWERYARNNLLRLYGDYLGKFISSNNPEWQGWVEHLVPLAEQDFYTLTSMMEAVFLRWDAKHLEQAKGWVKQAEHLRLRESLLLKRDESKFLYLKGFVLFQVATKTQQPPCSESQSLFTITRRTGQKGCSRNLKKPLVNDLKYVLGTTGCYFIRGKY